MGWDEKEDAAHLVKVNYEIRRQAVIRQTLAELVPEDEGTNSRERRAACRGWYRGGRFTVRRHDGAVTIGPSPAVVTIPDPRYQRLSRLGLHRLVLRPKPRALVSPPSGIPQEVTSILGDFIL